MINELTLEVSHKCNLKCIHCSSGDVKGKLHLAVINEYIKKYKPTNIRWSGGEPFMYLTEKHLNIADHRNVINIVTTNGTFIDKTTKFMDKKLIDELRISLYGYRPFHEAVTQVDGSFRKVWRLLEVLEEKDYTKKIVITSPYWNKEQKSDVLDIAKMFNLKTRITSLVPNLDVENGNTCSTGNIPCNYYEKVLIRPNGEIIHCAAEKNGFICKYFIYNKG